MSEIGRLALRHEGNWWNAYWARSQHSMEGAVLLGSIRIHLATGAAKQQFMVAMQEAFNNACQDVTGEMPTWSEPHAAPEDERAGHG